MLTREATYEDYGFSEDEDKRLGEFCKNLEMRDKILRNLLKCGLKPEKQESLLEKQKPIQSRNLLSMQRDRAAAMQKCFI